MTNSRTKILHDATPSWNGFNYQGKVGLYVVLKNILDQCGDSNFENYILEHSIEFEWAEDFSIKKREVYISHHQVKHNDKTKLNCYKDTLKTIIYRKNSRITDKDIIKYIKENQTSSAQEEIQTVLSQLKSSDILGDENRLDSDWQSNLAKINIIYKESIELCFLEFNKFVVNSQNCNFYLHTSQELTEPSNKLIQNLFDGNHNLSSLSIHYFSKDNPTQNNYSLALSDTQLQEELNSITKNIISKLQPNNSYSCNDILVYISSLKSLIDHHICERHKYIRENTNCNNFSIVKPVLNFEAFTKILKKEYRDQNDEYWDLVCRENFENAFEKYIGKIQVGNCPENKILRLEEYRNKLILEIGSKFSHLFEKLSPNEKYIINKRIYYENVTKIDSIQNVFLEFISLLDCNEFDSTIQFMCSNNIERFQTSCINLCCQGIVNTYAINLESARKGLIANKSNNNEALHNVNYLVVKTDQISIETTGLETITEINENNKEKTAKYEKTDKYTSPKEMYFIGIRQAVEKING